MGLEQIRRGGGEGGKEREEGFERMFMGLKICPCVFSTENLAEKRIHQSAVVKLLLLWEMRALLLWMRMLFLLCGVLVISKRFLLHYTMPLIVFSSNLRKWNKRNKMEFCLF